ncbi:MAG: threonylcarbamoyl-AMP synthase [Methylococcales bacterium]|nr:threonylcarbamoyl-AMP synthase [Methylococcales bacterium]MCK5924604.1 threonylcarbamoyl-AMP synthase [Methylococcales bacterium]
MAQYFSIHPDNPQARLIRQAVDIIKKGGVIAYPTDSSYALGCQLDYKQSADTIRRIRQLDNKHHFTLVCADLAQVSTFTKIANNAYRLIKSLTPGAFTFVLDATREVPKRLQNPKKKTIGIRIPDNPIVQALLIELGEPLLSSTLILPDEVLPLSDPYEIRENLEHELALVIDGGVIDNQPTTVINFVDDRAEIIRQGLGLAPMLD